jgi:hypothetical protein
MKAFFKQNNDETFSIQVFYHPRIVEFFKTIEDKSYNAETHSFSFPNKYREEVVGHLVNLSVVIDEVTEIPPGKSYPKTVKWRVNDNVFEVYMAFNKQATSVLRATGSMFKRGTCRWSNTVEQKERILNELSELGYVCKEVVTFPEVVVPLIKVKLLSS